MKKGEAKPTNAFKLWFDNFYETMDIAGVENILQSKKITNNGSQAS